MTQSLQIVIPGGSGQIGTILARHFHGSGHRITVLAREAYTAPWEIVTWDGKTRGNWISALERADVLINLVGRSVNCRYTAKNRAQIRESRIATTRLLGDVVGHLANPPRLWLNAGTATIYRHALDRPMDEATGEIGGREAGAPSAWRFSIDVATTWEQAFFSAATPCTRKVALRSAMIMSPDAGGIFDQLLRLVRFGLGGAAGSGQQFVSWIHDTDFVRCIDYLIAHEQFDGAVNLAAPNPVPNRDFMRAIREAAGIPIGIAVPQWILEIGAIALRTETELILKSRRVVPGRLLQSGFEFKFPEWPKAAASLLKRWKTNRSSAQAGRRSPQRPVTAPPNS